MSAHSLLVLHNLSVLDIFFASIRDFISHASNSGAEVNVNGDVESGVERKVGTWEEEVKRFEEYYDETLEVFDEAKTMWRDVDLARGKGRLAREKKKQEESVLGTSVEL
ncbi:hypothetical protein NP233_g6527 [Leucocoprinus birnbaumii]|uniref:Uncharacterized protein n=1 Tax=Leucocoprinus birnbaumii TaxID=56174 RepID=A0AAD5VUE1_9AGAR|nr:hypothetical protein NP233_g6527 [Leucocoprinus birnbaumii]